MKTTLAIVSESCLAIIRSPLGTLRALAPGILVLLLFAALLLWAMLTGRDTGLALPLSALLAFWFGLILCAVRWHRFALRADPTDALPAPSTLAFYALDGLKIAIAMIVPVLGIFFVAGILHTITGLTSFEFSFHGQSLWLSSPNSFWFSALSSWVLTFVFLRLCLFLPAAAVNARLSFNDCWNATGRVNTSLICIAFLIVALNALASLAAAPAGGENVLFDPGQLLFRGGISLLVLSVMTTLYAHLIENRPIASLEPARPAL